MKAKKYFTNIRILIFIAVLLMAVIAIHPIPNNQGVVIRSVEKNSSAALAGIESPNPKTAPMSKEKIIQINNIAINNEQEYHEYVSSLETGRKITVKTNRDLYKLEVKEEEKGNPSLGMSVYNAPSTNIRKGIDLQGGTRVLLKPEEEISQKDMEILLENMKQRLNIYGLSDIVVRSSSDLSGNQYVLVEIAGVNEEEVKELLAKQGKFEAKISNNTVFRGGEDIKYVCRSADCSGIDPYGGCQQIQETGDWVCRFRFAITLSQEAAEKQANLTENLEVIMENNKEYLNESLELYLDNELVDTLRIGADLRGKAITDIAISGSGTGANQQEAMINSLKEMKRLQTILITGSLPVKLDIVKTDALSPSLGQEFVENAFLVGLIAILVVGAVIFIRYREWKVTLLMMAMVVSEIIIILGVAAIIGWNIDLAAIAGIIIVAGSGVDHLIVITDETLGKENEYTSWKERAKRAIFIIMGAFFTTFVAMIPLLRAGAGLLKGFALTTMIRVSIGFLVTRPTYAKIIEFLMKD